VERALSRHHDVTVSNSGHDAIALVVGGERFDVIVSDLMMPEVTGMDVYRELARLVPEQARRMVFLTGGAFSVGARQFLQTVANPWLEKPFDIPDLLGLVARML
jgi:CheY-like chemotaxis protein